MTETKKYRLGNKPEQFEVSEKYLGWIPEFMKSWDMFHYEYALGGEYPKCVTLISPANEKKTLHLHQRLVKDVFPLHFFGEARAAEWHNFLIVSEQETPELQFIIPTY